MPDGATPAAAANHGRFEHPEVTADGETRAWVDPVGLTTLWFNTGTLCNLACEGCYIESSPTNDRLAYLTLAEALPFLDEIARDGHPTEEIGLTGGEPFMNPDAVPIIEAALARGFRVLVLTNAMKPMTHRRPALLGLRDRFGDRLGIRVSLDHHTRERHEELRGAGTWDIALDGLRWLSDAGFAVSVAGRTLWGEPVAEERAGYARLFADLGVAIDPDDPAALVLFPEMDAASPVPEITTRCWGILNKRAEDQMCATSRMVIKRKGAARPGVVACTLLVDDPYFELGATLAEALRPVRLKHRFCAQFCVLGGASCSPS